MFDRQSIHIALLLWGCIFSLIAALCMFLSRSFEPKKRRWIIGMELSCAVLLCSDAVAWAFRGGSAELDWWMTRIGNFLVFFFSDVVLLLFHGYVCYCLFEKYPPEKKPRGCIAAGYLIALVGMMLVILSQFIHLYYYFDADNFYHRTLFYPFALILPMMGMLHDLHMLLRWRTNISTQNLTAMLSYIALPFGAAMIQMFYYGVSLINISIAIAMIFMFVAAMIEQNQNLAESKRQLEESRISIMLSQMQPHFMYNVLNTIYYLCKRDPQLAQEAIDKFSDYLRNNMSSLEQTEMIPFREEYQHIQTYLSLEQIRFRNTLRVEYDIETDDFMLPPLSVQPLVENAVRHGVTKKRGGGTVTLATRRLPDCYVVTVRDTGNGFDPEHYMEDGAVHIGIRNVRERLHGMADGILEIRSEYGVGTTATVTIPKREAKQK